MTGSTEESDQAIVDRITSGDVDAYALILERYEPKLHRYATYLIHDQMAAHDVVQETFIKAYQNMRSFNPKYKFSSWIYRIAHNEAMNAIKKTKHTTDYDISTLPDNSYGSHMDEVVDKKILKADVQACIDELDTKYREVIQLVYFERLKYDDISDVLHVPSSTVGVWLLRAKSRLKLICEKKGLKR